jgi:hypothetical protein
MDYETLIKEIKNNGINIEKVEKIKMLKEIEKHIDNYLGNESEEM